MWLEKIGAIEPFSGNLATCYNNINEEEALERYKILTDKSVVFPKFQILNNNNFNGDGWLGASPDGVVEENVYGLPSEGVLEIKCPFFDGDINKAFPWKRIPLYCMPQAQGLMEILDRDWMDLYVWTPNGSSLFRLYRDVEYWDAIKTALDDFWWNHVQPAKELYRASIILPSPSGLKLLIVRNSDDDSPTKFEIWGPSNLEKEFLVPQAVHGSLFTDAWFEGVSWNLDETLIAYVAEEPTPLKPLQ
uniref:YqaJ viral recombinase domain-containing protein n=1 Tax=Chenopodium quinoa TaxID=63459 RepID=A0A803MUA4_CHEQI